MQIEDILVDHAYCEQKAASSCISLIVQFPEQEELVKVLTPVVAEEWAHFERVIEQLQKRGYKLGKQPAVIHNFIGKGRVQIGINPVEAMAQYRHRFQVVFHRGLVCASVDSISQPTHHQHILGF